MRHAATVQTEGARTEAARRIDRLALLFAALVLGVAVALLVLGGPPELLQKAVKDDVGGTGGAGELSSVTGAITDFLAPLTIAFGSLVSVGLLAGGAALAIGSKMGIKLIASSGLAGAVVLVGNGIAA